MQVVDGSCRDATGAFIIEWEVSGYKSPLDLASIDTKSLSISPVSMC